MCAVPVLTDRGQLIFHLKHHPLPHILQEADDLVVPELGQVDAVHRLDVVSHVQLVTPTGENGGIEREFYI